MLPDDVIGLIPCGGLGTRISPLPCSKELFPVGLGQAKDRSLRPKVVSHYLLEKMREGGVRRAFFILRNGKWDIPQYYGDGATFGMDLGYLVMSKPYGPPYTIDQAYPFVRKARIVFGFPDILFRPRDAFKQALDRMSATRAALVLGLFPAHKTWLWHRVATDRSGRVQGIFLNPSETTAKVGWLFAVWTSRFTEFLHQYLKSPRTSAEKSGSGLPEELTVGAAFQAAISEGLPTQSVTFPRRTYLDIGTPEDLQRVAARLSPNLIS
jgi:glucose-1-phosphate thymidylyltransferase